MASLKSFIDWVKGGEVGGDYEEDVQRTPAFPEEEPASFGDYSYRAREREPRREAPRSDAYRDYMEHTVSPKKEYSSSLRENKVVNINATAQLSVVIVTPERFENASEIADHLKNRRTVVLNLEQTNKDVARRLVDFLSGVAYANEGKIKKVANSTFIITPYNVDIMGDLIDELESSGVYF